MPIEVLSIKNFNLQGEPKENGKNLTDFQAQTMVEAVIKSAAKQKSPPGLPYKYVKDTVGDEGPQIDKFFKKVVTDEIKPGRLLAETTGKDRKVIQELFGKIEDPRFSIYNSMTKLSAIARKNELFEKLAKQDEAIKKTVTYARNLCPNIEWSCEDAGRSNLDYL